MEKLEQLGTIAIAIPIIALNLYIAGLFIPVNREHCAVSESNGGVGVSSSWTFSILSPLTASNTTTCVRNTVSREVVGWIGIWPLGSPTEQVENNLRVPQ